MMRALYTYVKATFGLGIYAKEATRQLLENLFNVYLYMNKTKKI